MTTAAWKTAENHLLGTDTFMAGLISTWGHCTLRPRTDYFTQLCRSIIGQQLATKAAEAIYGRFAAYYESEPTPALIADTPPQTLRELGLSGQKITYISDLAAHVLDRRLDLENLEALTDQQVIEQLVAVKGIGVWTAQMFLIFALNRPDILPTDDFGVRKAIMRGYGLAAMPKKTEMETIAHCWHPWRSVASWYLWRSLENA